MLIRDLFLLCLVLQAFNQHMGRSKLKYAGSPLLLTSKEIKNVLSVMRGKHTLLGRKHLKSSFLSEHIEEEHWESHNRGRINEVLRRALLVGRTKQLGRKFVVPILPTPSPHEYEN